MYVSVNGIQLHYTEMGTGDPLLLLHSNGASLRIFQDIMPQLAKNFHVYAVDSRGHGKSSKVKELDYTVMAQDIAEMILALGLKKPILYGYSDGGIIGLLLAIAHPEMLKKLIVSGVNITPDGIKPMTRLLWRIGYLLTRSPNVKLMLTQPQISSTQLKRICVPTVLLAGERDIVSEAHSRAIATGIPASTLQIIPRESHGSYIHDNHKLYNILRPYLFSEPIESDNPSV